MNLYSRAGRHVLVNWCWIGVSSRWASPGSDDPGSDDSGSDDPGSDEAGEEQVPGYLTESVSPINVIVMADVDLLEDRFWIREDP